MRSLAVSVGIVCALEALIMVMIGVIPPTLTVHWWVLGIGLGLPVAVFGLAVVVALILNRFVGKAPGDIDAHLRERSSVQLHSGLPGSTAHHVDEE